MEVHRNFVSFTPKLLLERPEIACAERVEDGKDDVLEGASELLRGEVLLEERRDRRRRGQRPRAGRAGGRRGLRGRRGRGRRRGGR